MKKMKKKEKKTDEDWTSDFSCFGIQPISANDVLAEYELMVAENNTMCNESQEVDNLETILSSVQVMTIQQQTFTEENMEMDVKDEDLNDPQWIMELQKLGINQEGNMMTMKEKKESLQKQAIEYKRNGNVQAALEIMKEIKTLEDPNIPEKIQSVDLNVQIEEAKRQAVSLKRGGDLKGALEAMRFLKQLQEQKKELEKIVLVTVSETDVKDVQVTDEDLEDPKMNSELEALGWGDEEEGEEDQDEEDQEDDLGNSVDLVDAFDQSPPAIDASCVPPHVSQVVPVSFTVSPEKKIQQEEEGSSLEASLEEQINLKRKSVLRLHREGKETEARLALKRMKQLESKLKEATPPSISRIDKFNALEAELVRFANQAMAEAKELAASDRERAKIAVEKVCY